MKQQKLMARVLGLGLCASLLSTVTLAAAGTPFTGAAADITAPEGQVATLIVNGQVTRFDGSDKTYTDGDNAQVVYTDRLDDAGSRLSSFYGGGEDETDDDYAYHTGLFVDENGVVEEKSGAVCGFRLYHDLAELQAPFRRRHAPRGV